MEWNKSLFSTDIRTGAVVQAKDGHIHNLTELLRKLRLKMSQNLSKQEDLALLKTPVADMKAYYVAGYKLVNPMIQWERTKLTTKRIQFRPIKTRPCIEDSKCIAL